MSSPFVAEIRIFAGNFAPRGWATCDGQILPLSQNTALFSLLGTYYGGDGKSNFALPNLGGSAPMHQGQGPGLTDHFIGETGGSQNVTLLQSEMPAHNHQAFGINTSGQVSPQNNSWGAQSGRTPPPQYSSANPDVMMSPNALGIAGSGLPHNNMQPSLALTFIIALQGVYPARS